MVICSLFDVSSSSLSENPYIIMRHYESEIEISKFHVKLSSLEIKLIKLKLMTSRLNYKKHS